VKNRFADHKQIHLDKNDLRLQDVEEWDGRLFISNSLQKSKVFVFPRLSVIFRSPRPLPRSVFIAFYGGGTEWAAVEATKFAVAAMPHKGAGLQFITVGDFLNLIGCAGLWDPLARML
jgi:hypothetical protein